MITWRLPRFSAFESVLRQSASTDIFVIYRTPNVSNHDPHTSQTHNTSYLGRRVGLVKTDSWNYVSFETSHTVRERDHKPTKEIRDKGRKSDSGRYNCEWTSALDINSMSYPD